MTPDVFLFDLDGTLVDSVGDLTTAINLLRGEIALPPLEEETVRSYIGDGATVLVTRALPEVGFSAPRLQRFLALYREHLIDRTTLYPGIADFLAHHAGRPMAVVTNKPFPLAWDLLNGLGLLPYFPVVLGSESCPAKKPDPTPVLVALERLGAPPERAVMIGDHHTDLRAGRAAAVRTCFCAWGVGEDGGIPFDYLARTPEDLLHLFPPNDG